MSSLQHFLLHRMGCFHVKKPKTTLGFSDDLSSAGGTLSLKDGVPVVERVDLNFKIDHLKTLFFTASLDIIPQIQSYFQRFQGVRAEKNEKGQWTLIDHHMAARQLKITPVGPENKAEILDLLAQEKHLSADEILMLDHDLIEKMKAVISASPESLRHDPQIITCVDDFFTKDLSKVLCIDTHSNSEPPMPISESRLRLLKEKCSMQFHSIEFYHGPERLLNHFPSKVFKNCRELYLEDDSFTFDRLNALECLDLYHAWNASSLKFSENFQSHIQHLRMSSDSDMLLLLLDNPNLVTLERFPERDSAKEITSHSARALLHSWPKLGELYPNLKFVFVTFDYKGFPWGLHDKAFEYLSLPQELSQKILQFPFSLNTRVLRLETIPRMALPASSLDKIPHHQVKTLVCTDKDSSSIQFPPLR